jgi:hypothetical protein
MAEYIPFITSSKARDLVKRIYPDAEIVRVSLDLAQKISFPESLNLWIDPGVDGLHDLEARKPRPDRRDPEIERTNSWYELMKEIPGFEAIADAAFAPKPDPGIVTNFVTEILNRSAKKNKRGWITVPQLPIVGTASRNKINRALAKATGEWKSSHTKSFTGRLILPLIFTNQTQINGKTQRNPKVEQAERCYHDAHADGFWAVDSTLMDDSGSRTLRNTRLPALIDLHTELNRAISSKIRIAGPYWGMNLVLWARGLIDYPAIGVGSSYQYHLSGGPGSPANVRIAIGVLRRRVSVAQLKPWLEKTLQQIEPKHPAYISLGRIRNKLQILRESETAREQVARFYKEWLQVLAGTPRPGRPLALFQDLAKAYAFGKSLDEFKDEGTARRPESVVEPLMLTCL